MMSKLSGRGILVSGSISALFLLYGSTLLTTLAYNYDEGVYIYQSQEILAGRSPIVDFFSHQTPTYLYVLAPVGLVAPHSVFGYRFVSLLATALGGLVAYVLGRRYFSEIGALFGQVLYCTAALQYYGLLALPTGLMMATSTAGMYLVAFHDSRRALVAGSVLMTASVLLKPVAVSTGLALALYLLLPTQRKKLVVCVPTVALSAVASWALLDLPTGGMFSRLLRLQFFRFSGDGGFEVMSTLAPFQELLDRINVKTALGWNLMEHYRAFVFDFNTETFAPSLSLLILVLIGQTMILTPAVRIPWARRILLSLWWFLPFLFSLFVWEPVFDHYFVQYLPPMVILAAIPLHWLATRSRFRRTLRIVAVAILLASVAQTAYHWNNRRWDYSMLTQPEAEGEVWLTFDPFLNFVTGTRPACGLIDPFNVYGNASLTAIVPNSVFARFSVSRDDLVACLEADPEIKIGLGMWSGFFLDPELTAYFDAQPPERLVQIP